MTWEVKLIAKNDEHEMVCSTLVDADDREQATMTGFVIITTMLDMEIVEVLPGGTDEV